VTDSESKGPDPAPVVPNGEDETSAPDTDALQDVIGHRFADPTLLARALVHSSARAELSIADNETYEYLGDAVLDLAIAELLMQQHPDFDEGALSKRRAALVSARPLALVAGTLGLDAALRLGKGEENSGGRMKPRILAGVYEAVIGAVFLDAGYEACRVVVANNFAELLAGDPNDHGDHKTELQELTQREHKTIPNYEVVGISGPDHARVYDIVVTVDGRELARATGSSRKLAEQAAAKHAIQELARS